MKQHIKDYLREAYLSGLSFTDIEKNIGLDRVTAYRWCKDIARSKSESLSGERHPLYKGGSINSGGYHVVWIKGKLVKKHRLVANAPIGLVVHHKNGNKLDNDPNNLELLTLSEHTRLHNLKKNSCVNI